MNASLRKISTWSLAILLPVVAAASPGGRFAKDGPESSATPKSQFVTEEHWMVDETTRAITEMLAFAAQGSTDGLELTVTPQAGAAQTYKIEAKLHGASMEAILQWKDYIWSPAEYAPWVEKLVAAWKLTPPASPTNDQTLIEVLTTPTPKVFHREAQRISEALSKAPLDAGLHEQAALITAAFAFRDLSQDFLDIRRENCRTVAHLAIAEALQPKSSSSVRKCAAAALQTHIGRGAAALALIADLAHDPTPGAAAWGRATRLRAVYDWREAVENPTLFEQFEIFLARVRAVNSQFAFEWLQKRRPAMMDDWRHSVLEDDFSVGMGHAFAAPSVPQEILSLEADWSLFFGKKLQADEVVKALSEPAAGCVSRNADGREGISVLGWDLWSAQHQHHLCQAIRATINFLRDKWGVPEYRDAQKQFRKIFAGLTLLPVLERELTEDESEIPAISTRVSKLLTAHPEALPPVVWGHLLKTEAKAAALSIDRPQSWVQPAIPFGTTYELGGRTHAMSFPEREDSAWWDAKLRLAPMDYAVLVSRLFAKYGNGEPTDAELQETEATYVPVKDYCYRAMRWLSYVQGKSLSPHYFDTMRRMCEIDPDNYFSLGDHYVGADQPEKAAEAYRKGVDLATDRVLMSSDCRWFVNYLDDHGRAEEAMAIAREAAEVYSSRGLETMALLQEKHGKLNEAEDYFKKIAERYNDSNPLHAFYGRNRDKNPDYESAVSGIEGKLFPDGVKKTALTDLSGPPADGAAVTSDSPSLRAAGLKVGDIIVAIDGYRVQDEEQYLYLRGLSDDPKFRLIIWNGSSYREIKANVAGRRFNVQLSDYHGK